MAARAAFNPAGIERIQANKNLAINLTMQNPHIPNPNYRSYYPLNQEQIYELCSQAANNAKFDQQKSVAIASRKQAKQEPPIEPATSSQNLEDLLLTLGLPAASLVNRATKGVAVPAIKSALAPERDSPLINTITENVYVQTAENVIKTGRYKLAKVVTAVPAAITSHVAGIMYQKVEDPADKPLVNLGVKTFAAEVTGRCLYEVARLVINTKTGPTTVGTLIKGAALTTAAVVMGVTAHNQYQAKLNKPQVATVVYPESTPDSVAQTVKQTHGVTLPQKHHYHHHHKQPTTNTSFEDSKSEYLCRLHQASKCPDCSEDIDDKDRDSEKPSLK